MDEQGTPSAFQVGEWVIVKGRRRGCVTAVSNATRIVYLKDAAGHEFAAEAVSCERVPAPIAVAAQPERDAEQRPKPQTRVISRRGRGNELHRSPALPDRELDRAVEIYYAKRALPQLSIGDGIPPKSPEL